MNTKITELFIERQSDERFTVLYRANEMESVEAETIQIIRYLDEVVDAMLRHKKSLIKETREQDNKPALAILMQINHDIYNEK